MPRVILTEQAVRGLERCRTFLAEESPIAAKRAAETIVAHFDLLAVNPQSGRLSPSAPDLRELVIPFGRAGYVALYDVTSAGDLVRILAFRHQREAGWR